LHRHIDATARRRDKEAYVGTWWHCLELSLQAELQGFLLPIKADDTVKKIVCR
jgi:hypothetical protein